jgi:small multidrug resistance family-3 protein
MAILKSVLIFILVGFCEIGGGYLVWFWLKEEKPLWYGILGGSILVLYGVVATLLAGKYGIWQATNLLATK